MAKIESNPIESKHFTITEVLIDELITLRTDKEKQ